VSPCAEALAAIAPGLVGEHAAKLFEESRQAGLSAAQMAYVFEQTGVRPPILRFYHPLASFVGSKDHHNSSQRLCIQAPTRADATKPRSKAGVRPAICDSITPLASFVGSKDHPNFKRNQDRGQACDFAILKFSRLPLA
jgi:hypothetical protein